MLVSGICTKPGDTIGLTPDLVQVPLTSTHYRSHSWLGTDTTNKHTLSLSLPAW
jgi:hypothetical protein